MAHLIDKDILVAEIERRMSEQQEICKSDVAHGKECNPKNVEVIYQFQQFIKDLDSIEVKEVYLNYNKKTAILLSSHQEVARLFINSLDCVYSMANNPKAEDLLKVIDITGKVYWCDEIEFIEKE